MHFKSYFSILIIVVFFFACVEPFPLNFGSQGNILFVEANLNDTDTKQIIALKTNLPSNSGINYLGVEGAIVEVIENESEVIPAKEGEFGNYLLPDDFKIKLNTNYRLKFTLKNGKKYESALENIGEAPEIDQVFSIFKKGGIPHKNKVLDGHEIYLNTKDDLNVKNYYFWQWKLYEKQNYCVSCDGGRYFTNPLPLGRCVEDANLKRRGVFYDYICQKDCWDIIYNEEVNIMSDAFSNGELIKDRLIAKIPFYQFKSSLIEIQQFSIPKSAFDYFNLIIAQSQNNGSLADTPPAGLIGNVKNTEDPFENVGGIFLVSSKKVKRFWIERENIETSMPPFGLLKGRLASPEPLGNDTTRPPLSPCIEDKNRTSIKPLGWIN
jgi:hypothetical protein